MSDIYSANKPTITVMALAIILISLGLINMGDAIIITGYWLSIQIFSTSSNINSRLRMGLVISVISIALLAHKISGFHNILLYKDIMLSPSSAPHSAHVNFDKTFLILLLSYYYSRQISSPRLMPALRKSLSLGLIASFVLLIPALLTGYLKFEPKIPSIFPELIILNLIAVISEEALFRGFIQTALNEMFESNNSGAKYNKLLALVMTSSLFGTAHYAGGTTYVLLSFVASLFYGYALMKTKRIEASIAVHFIVNLLHILLFTYPYAA